MRQILHVARREFLETARSRWFVIGTVLFPLLMGSLIFLPMLLVRSGGSATRCVVLDETGVMIEPLREALKSDERLREFELVEAPAGAGLDALRQAVASEEYQGLLHLPGPDRPAKTMAGVAEAWLIALGKGAPDAPYHSLYVWGSLAVGGEGLFRSDDVGLSFRRVDDARHRYGRLLSLAADPLEHGTVYLAPHGRGVVVGRPRGSP